MLVFDSAQDHLKVKTQSSRTIQVGLSPTRDEAFSWDPSFWAVALDDWIWTSERIWCC